MATKRQTTTQPRRRQQAARTRKADDSRTPAAERASIYLRELLFDGELHTGDRIDQDEIAEQLGISRQPVREAVLALADDGLLVIRPRHGVFVARFDAETVRGHYELNGYLQGYAAAKVALYGDAATLERLAQLHKDMMRRRDPVEIQEASAEFYRTINVATGNPRLFAAFRLLQRFVPGSALARYPAMIPVGRRGSGAVLDAIERHDPDAAGQACIDEWVEGGEVVVADLIARGIIAEAPAQAKRRKARR